MKKQELIHLHGLLAEVSQYCEQDEVPVDLSEYRDIGTRPTSIHLSKSDHKEAVFALTHGITAGLPVEEATPVPTSAD